MKRTSFLSVLLALLLVCGLCLPASAATESGYTPKTSTEISAKAIYLYNLDTGRVIYEKDADVPMPPASLTKVMTAILALENTPNLDTEMVTYPMSVQDFLYTYQLENGMVSSGNLMAGEEMSMRDYLYAMMLPSANEAAMSVANHISGSQEGFADLMNTRAAELGCTGTTFVNANGLYDPGHLTTARDLATMTLHAMELPGFMEIVTTTSYTAGPTNKHDSLLWETTNQMQVRESSYYYPGLEGIKTGTLEEAGRCFISTASQNGFNYLLVLMGCDYLDDEGNLLPTQKAFDETAAIYNWVFDQFRTRKLVEKGTIVDEVPVNFSLDKEYVHAVTDDYFADLLPEDLLESDVKKEIIIPESLDAPVTKGQPLGEMILIYNDTELGRVPLVTSEAVEASKILLALETAKEIAGSLWFKFALVFLALLIVFFVVLAAVRRRNKRRRQGYLSGDRAGSKRKGKRR